MSRTAYPLKLPASVEARCDAAREGRWRLAQSVHRVGGSREGGSAGDRSGIPAAPLRKAKPRDLLKFTRRAGREAPSEADRR